MVAKDMEDMLLRDRNHPSVVLWSIGNELQEAWESSDEGVERAKCCRILFTKKNRVVWQFSLRKTTIRKSFPV